MHELSLATEVYRLCRSRAAGGRIERVKVAVGELSAVEPDLLRYAWEAVTATGPDAGAALEIDWREAAQVCESCRAPAVRDAGGWLVACPDCGGALRVEGGRELDVLELRYAPALVEGSR
jgi:hydrogenase nickel incorporation protein HypA/HybF